MARICHGNKTHAALSRASLFGRFADCSPFPPMGRSGMIKRAIPALIAVALVGCSDKKPAIGRFQVREFILDEYYGDKNTKAVTHGLSHLLIKTDTATADSWYWFSAYVDGKHTKDEWKLMGMGGLNPNEPLTDAQKAEMRRTIFGEESPKSDSDDSGK